jgi:hypothetical protein
MHQLGLVVLFDDLACGMCFGLCGEAHHQHRSDGEVRAWNTAMPCSRALVSLAVNAVVPTRQVLCVRVRTFPPPRRAA